MPYLKLRTDLLCFLRAALTGEAGRGAADNEEQGSKDKDFEEQGFQEEHSGFVAAKRPRSGHSGFGAAKGARVRFS